MYRLSNTWIDSILCINIRNNFIIYQRVWKKSNCDYYSEALLCQWQKVVSPSPGCIMANVIQSTAGFCSSDVRTSSCIESKESKFDESTRFNEGPNIYLKRIQLIRLKFNLQRREILTVWSYFHFCFPLFSLLICAVMHRGTNFIGKITLCWQLPIFLSIFPVACIIGRFPERHDETFCKILIKLPMLIRLSINFKPAFISWYRYCIVYIVSLRLLSSTRRVFLWRSNERLLWSKVFLWLVCPQIAHCRTWRHLIDRHARMY